MDTKVNFTLVGLFVVVLGAALIVLVLWLTSMKRGDVYNTYAVYMHEEVSGLNVQSPVRYNGVKVGYVKSVRLNPNDPQQVILILKVLQGTPVTTSTIATLMSEGITGMDYVGLKALTAQARPLKARPGEAYQIIPSEPSLLMKLSTAVQEITKTIKDLSGNVSKVFDKKNQLAISKSLSNIQKITSTLAKNSNNLTASMVSARKFLKNSAIASERLPAVMQQIQATLVAVKKTTNHLSDASHSVASTMNDTRSAVQNISQQLVPSAEQLMTQLNDIAGNLQQLSGELQHNPSVLVRGKYPAQPGPGEK